MDKYYRSNMLQPKLDHRIQKNIGLNDSRTCEHVVQFLLKYIGYQKLHQQIQPLTEKDLPSIKKDYLACPTYPGTRSWIIFFHRGHKYYALNFPKFDPKQGHPILYRTEVLAARSLYAGTIMEGVFFRLHGQPFLVIDEVYLLAGENQLTKPKDDRMKYLEKYLDKHLIRNPEYNIYVCQYYRLERQDLELLYHKIRSDPQIGEILFYPVNYGGTIYSYLLTQEDLVDQIVRTTHFRLRKVATDVYQILDHHGHKLGLASIPDLATSRMCRDWFKKKREILAACRLDPLSQKWIPVKLVRDTTGQGVVER